MKALPLFHALAGQAVLVLGKGDAADAKRRLVERAGGLVVDDETADARLAFVALDQPEAAVARLKARGLLVNVVDRPDLCDFTTPSILERGPVLIAVGTGGVSAGLAKALRIRLEGILPQSLGALALALGRAKERMRAIWPEPAERRRQIDAALAQGSLADPLRDFDAKHFDAWLAGGQGSARLAASQRITVVLESDDPEDLTLRQARLLASADVLVHDGVIAPAILAMARADAVRRLIGEEDADQDGGTAGQLVVILRRG